MRRTTCIACIRSIRAAPLYSTVYTGCASSIVTTLNNCRKTTYLWLKFYRLVSKTGRFCRVFEILNSSHHCVVYDVLNKLVVFLLKSHDGLKYQTATLAHWLCTKSDSTETLRGRFGFSLKLLKYCCRGIC